MAIKKTIIEYYQLEDGKFEVFQNDRFVGIMSPKLWDVWMSNRDGKREFQFINKTVTIKSEL